MLYAFIANKVYCIAGKFGGNNVWLKWMDEYIFGKESLANEYVDQNVINCNCKYGQFWFGKPLMICQISKLYPQTFPLYDILLKKLLLSTEIAI